MIDRSKKLVLIGTSGSPGPWHDTTTQRFWPVKVTARSSDVVSSDRLKAFLDRCYEQGEISAKTTARRGDLPRALAHNPEDME